MTAITAARDFGHCYQDKAVQISESEPHKSLGDEVRSPRFAARRQVIRLGNWTLEGIPYSGRVT